jgi:hypothetical protein
MHCTILVQDLMLPMTLKAFNDGKQMALKKVKTGTKTHLAWASVMHLLTTNASSDN